MKDFAETLNLPHTTFSMRAGLCTKQVTIACYWEDYDKTNLLIFFKDRKKFLLYDGPPYANGNIHLGHAFNKCLKDIILRNKIVAGYSTALIPAWDCHGLPIELAVEKYLPKDNISYDTVQWVSECRKYASLQIEVQKDDIKKLGICADWNAAYSTMDFNYEAKVIQTLGRLASVGAIYQSLKPVYCCFLCKSSLSDAELIYEEEISNSVYFLSKILEPDSVSKNIQNKISDNTYLLAWTTTLWTISENSAFAIMSQGDYCYIENSDNKGIIMSLVSFNVLHKYLKELQDFNLHHTFSGQCLIGIQAKKPVGNGTSIVYHGDFVHHNPPSTGIVHISPSYGMDDFKLATRYEINFETNISIDGTYNNEHQFFPKRNIFSVAVDVITLLKENNCLFSILPHKHQYATCWRHKSPLFFLATKQWFLNLNFAKLGKGNVDLAKIISFPKEAKSILQKMVNERTEWCISRQRKWGIPLPFFVHKITSELHPETAVITDKIAQIVRNSGVEGYFNYHNLADIVPDLSYYRQVTDVVDVWFDSGCLPLMHQNDNNVVCADLICEGRDQYRGWFQSTYIICKLIMGIVPYKQFIAHGFIVDENNRKMSKSLGNVISPNDIVDNYGADILRIWVATSDYTKDIAISQTIIDLCVSKYRKIRNTIRFLLTLMPNIYTKEDIDNFILTRSLLSLDCYILRSTLYMAIRVQHEMDQYNIHHAFNIIYEHCVKELSAFYIEIVKDRHYTCKKDSKPYISLQITADAILQILLRVLAPFIPFTIQEVLLHCQQDHILKLSWEDVIRLPEEDKLISDSIWNIIKELISESNIMFAALQSSISDIRKDECLLILECTHELKRVLIPISHQDQLHIIFGCAKVMCVTSQNNRVQNYIPLKTTKCPRCWNRFLSLNKNSICFRCQGDLNSEQSSFVPVRIYV